MIGDRLSRAGLVQTFGEEFKAPLSRWTPDHPEGKWKTLWYGGNQEEKFGVGKLTREQMIGSRTYSGLLNLYGDEAWNVITPGKPPVKNPFWWNGEMLYLNVNRLTPAERVALTCDTRDYVSGYMSTERTFLQGEGYVEARVALGKASGQWPAFWLIPPGHEWELDVFEGYAGERPGVGPLLGKLFGTAHTDMKTGTPKQVTIPAQTLPVTPASQNLLGWNTHGLMRRNGEAIWYLNDREIGRIPFDKTDPAYMIFNVAVSAALAGDPALAPASAPGMVIDWVRAWA